MILSNPSIILCHLAFQAIKYLIIYLYGILIGNKIVLLNKKEFAKLPRLNAAIIIVLGVSFETIIILFVRADLMSWLLYPAFLLIFIFIISKFIINLTLLESAKSSVAIAAIVSFYVLSNAVFNLYAKIENSIFIYDFFECIFLVTPLIIHKLYKSGSIDTVRWVLIRTITVSALSLSIAAAVICLVLYEKSSVYLFAVSWILVGANFLFTVNYIISGIRIIRQMKEYFSLSVRYEATDAIIKEDSELRHEFINTTLAPLRRISSVTELLDFLEKKFPFILARVNNTSAASLKKILNNDLSSVVSLYLSKASYYGVVFNLNVNKEFEIKTIPEIDLQTIVGESLENAIRAAMECENEKRLVIMDILANDSDVNIFIKNKYKNKPDIDKIALESYTTKGIFKNTGMGIPYIIKKVKKNKNFIKHKIEIRNEFFEQSFLISTTK